MSEKEMHEAPRCQHTRLSGRRCKAPAKRGNNYCLFHEAEHETSPNLTFPPVEDAATVQVAADQVLQALRDNSIEFPRASLMLSGLRLMRANLRQLGLEMDMEEINPHPPAKSAGRVGQPEDEEEDGPGLIPYVLQQVGDLKPGEAEALRHASAEERVQFMIERLQLVPPVQSTVDGQQSTEGFDAEDGEDAEEDGSHDGHEGRTMGHEGSGEQEAST